MKQMAAIAMIIVMMIAEIVSVCGAVTECEIEPAVLYAEGKSVFAEPSPQTKKCVCNEYVPACEHAVLTDDNGKEDILQNGSILSIFGVMDTGPPR